MNCCWGSATHLFANSSSSTYLSFGIDKIGAVVTTCIQGFVECFSSCSTTPFDRMASHWYDKFWDSGITGTDSPELAERQVRCTTPEHCCWDFSPGLKLWQNSNIFPNTIRSVHVKCTYWWHLRLPLNAFTNILLDICNKYRYLVRELLYPLENHREVNEGQDPRHKQNFRNP